MSTRIAWWLPLVLLWVPSAVAADDPRCGNAYFEGGTDVEVRPPDGATGVARNAPIIVRHLAGADLDALEAKLDGEPLVALMREQGAGPLRVRVDSVVERLDERTLALSPSADLAANTEYYLRIARPGFEGAGYAEQSFVTGDTIDEAPPELDASESSFQVSVEAIPEACGLAPASHRVVLSLPAAEDDGDDDSIEYLVFLTRGDGIEAPQLRARARAQGDTIRTAFVLSATEAASPICVAVRATDTLGQVSEASPEACFDPQQRNTFRGCTLAPNNTPPSPLAALLACVVGLGRGFLRRRRA